MLHRHPSRAACLRPLVYDVKKLCGTPTCQRITICGTLTDKRTLNFIFGGTPRTASRHPCAPWHPGWEPLQINNDKPDIFPSEHLKTTFVWFWGLPVLWHQMCWVMFFAQKSLSLMLTNIFEQFQYKPNSNNFQLKIMTLLCNNISTLKRFWRNVGCDVSFNFN